MRKYRICMVLSRLGIGGAETHVLTLAETLHRMGHEVTVVHDAPDVYPPLTGVRRICLPIENRRRPLYAVSLLRRLLLEGDFDVVHAHARYPALLCRMAGARPLVTTAHWVFKADLPHRLLSVWGEKTLAVSADIKAYLMREYGLKEEDILTTVNGVDAARYHPTRRTGRIKITLCSRLDAGRALSAYALVHAAAALPFGRVEVRLVGDGSEFERLSLLAGEINRRAGEERVRLYGARTDVWKILGETDVFVGVSRAALEAMAAGCTVILAGDEGYLSVFSAHDASAAEESNFCCRSAQKTTVRLLSRDLLALCSLPRRTLTAMGRENRAYVTRRYGTERMAADALSVYRSVAGRTAVLCGYYGFGNVGDEMMQEALCRRLYRAGYTRVLPLSSAGGWCRAWLALLEGADFFLGGGNLLQDATSSRSLRFYLTWLTLARRAGVGTALLSSGIGPLSGKGKRRTGEVLAFTHAVECRTPSDAKEVRALCPSARVGITQDAVLTLPAPKKRGDERVIVALRPYQAGDTMTEYDFLLTVDRLLKEISPKEGILFPMHPSDAPFCHALGQKYGIKTASGGVGEFLSLLGECRFLVSNRLHGGVCALLAGVPALLLAEEEKLFRFVGDVREIAEGLGLPSPATLYDGLPASFPAHKDILAVRTALSQRCEKI